MFPIHTHIFLLLASLSLGDNVSSQHFLSCRVVQPKGNFSQKEGLMTSLRTRDD